MAKPARFIWFLALLFGCQSAENTRIGPPISMESGRSLTIMSFNIRMGAGRENFGTSPYEIDWGSNVAAVESAIRSADPDIVGLQEVAGSSQAKQLAKALNMNNAFVWHPSRGSPWWGLAVLSKLPIVDVKQFIMSPNRSFMHVRLGDGKHTLLVVNIHKNPRLFDGTSLPAMLESLDNDDTPAVVIEDFNMGPLDHRLDEMKNSFLDTGGAYRERNPILLGTWDHSAGSRIDYVFVEKDRFHVVEAGLVSTDHHEASDHIAYFAKVTRVH